MIDALRLRGFDPVFFISHLLFLGFSYCIYLAPYIAPSTFPYFGFIPIFYPFIALINVLLIVYLLWRRTGFGVLFLLLSLGLYFPFSKTYQLFGNKSDLKPDFKIISLNAQYFRKEGFIEYFDRENPDIVVFQEAYRKNENFQRLKENSFPDYFHESNSLIQILSRYPIIEFQPIFTDSQTRRASAAYADIDMGKDTLRVINLYLESMMIQKEEVKNVLQSREEAEKNSKILKNKLTRGFLLHEIEIKEILPFIRSSPHPVIMAGDLNSVPYSYVYGQTIFWLKDTFAEVGRGSGTSFHDFKYPVRIDYIFHSEELKPVSYEVRHDVDLSDHYPVSAQFQLP